MSLATVQDILSGWRGWTTMDLASGNQISGQGSGQVIVKRLIDPLWTLHAESRPLSPNELSYWKARLDGLDDGAALFLGYDFSRKYPLAYKNGSWPTGGSFSGTSAAISSIGGDGKSLVLKSLPTGFTGKVGDMLQVTAASGSPAALALFRVMEDFTMGASVTGGFEVRGSIPAWLAANDAVSVKQPSCHMMLQPGSVQTPKDVTGRGVVSFDAIQVRNP